MCSLREQPGWASQCSHPPSGCGRDGELQYIPNTADVYSLNWFILFSKLVLYSESFSSFCRAGLGHFSCDFSIFASIVYCSLFACKSPWMQLAMAPQPARPLRTGCRTVLEVVTWHLVSHGSSWDHKHFWDPQGKRRNCCCLWFTGTAGALASCSPHGATFTPSVRVIRGRGNQGMSQPMQMLHIFFKNLTLLFIFYL